MYHHLPTGLTLLILSDIFPLLVSASAGAAAASVAGPSVDYVLFTGPLPVQYDFVNSERPSSYISLYKHGSDQLVAKQPVQDGVTQGIVLFDCGVISHAGIYEAHLYSDSEALVGPPATFSAVWPRFNLTLPATHVAREETHPELTSRYWEQRLVCRPDTEAIPFSMEVMFSDDLDFTDAVVVHREPDINLKKLNSNAQQFRCEIFDRAGFYRAELVSSDSGEVISSSNSMSVSWGDYYKITSPQQTVFPCSRELVVEYTRPSCVVREDNIHMFSFSTSKHTQRQLEYLYESKAKVGKSTASFNCDDIRSYQWRHHSPGFCFRYQTVAANQAVQYHQTFCLPSNSTIGLPVDGQWSQWADWSDCSGRCESSTQSRYRYCNSPTPSNGGRYCEGGGSVEWQKCPNMCEPVTTDQPTHLLTKRPASRIPNCWCGCTMSRPVGVIIPGRQCRGTVEHMVKIVWIIEGVRDSTVQLNITDFKWFSPLQTLKVRDGPSYAGQLLLDVKGSSDTRSQYVLSSGSSLHIEFTSDDEIPPQPDLFYATYKILMFEELSSAAPIIHAVTGEEGEEPVWKLAVIISGSVGGFILVISLIGFCAYKRVSSSSTIASDKTKQSIAGTSPNHVVIQVQDGEYTNFGDVTIAPSVRTTISKQKKSHRGRTNFTKRIATVEEEDFPSTTGPLPDPYHVTPEDFLHDTDILHVMHNKPTTAADNRHNDATHRNHRSRQQKKSKKRKSRHRRGKYEDPHEVDRLISSLPTGSNNSSNRPGQHRYLPQQSRSHRGDVDSEYRALINHLSSTGSHNHSEVVNTSAEVHLVPHTTPVEDTSQESPQLAPLLPAVGGHRSPCLDDGYNSLANTGSTQSNLSSRGRDAADPPRLNQIKEKPSSHSENSADISTNHCPKSQPLTVTESNPGGNSNSLHLSHITCPLVEPDGASDDQMSINYSEQSNKTNTATPHLTSSLNSSVQQPPTPPTPPTATTQPGPVYAERRKLSRRLSVGPSQDSSGGSNISNSRSTTNSDSYEFDDYMPPPVGCETGDSNWRTDSRLDGPVTLTSS